MARPPPRRRALTLQEGVAGLWLSRMIRKKGGLDHDRRLPEMRRSPQGTEFLVSHIRSRLSLRIFHAFRSGRAVVTSARAACFDWFSCGCNYRMWKSRKLFAGRVGGHRVF